MRKIKKAEKKNFETMQRAMRNGDVCIMVCTRVDNNREKLVVCVVNRPPDGSIELAPMAEMLDGEPYEIYKPPMEDGKCRQKKKH